MKLFLTNIFLLLSLSVFAQTGLPDRIQTSFKTLQENYLVEKAYLHLDKFTYTLGEELWFSAYLVAGGTQVPSPLSKTLYVDFFDGDGLLLTQKMIQMDNGRGAGDFKIPNFGKKGVYRIKAYTSWMKNFGEDYFFTQSFQVIDGMAGSFLPKVEFNEISSAEGKVRYQVAVQAVNSSGNPLSGKLIQVKALGAGEILFSQDYQLNALGEVEFGFSIPAQPYPYQNLELSFQENEDYINTQKVRLPYSIELADIQFLPEGGHWLIGKKSRLALRAVDPDGAPVFLTGDIENEPETDFSTNFAGLGMLEFIPKSDSYTATIRSSKFREVRNIPLPKPAISGLTIQVQNPEGGAFISAFIQGNEYNEELLLVSHTKGLINYMIPGKLANGVWGVRIPKKNLPSGINTLTVLDQSGKPLLERLVFIQNEDRLDLKLSGTSSLSSRGKLEFLLESKFNDNPAPGSFSIAVADAEQFEEESELYGTIFSHLLLSSDLKGTIYRPGFYFQNQDFSTKEALDLVMLTHGWTRFSWEDLLDEKYPDLGHYIEQGISIQGKIKEQTQTKKGLGGGKISALVGEGIELISTGYGPDGNFLLSNLSFQDLVTVTITAEDQRAKNSIELELDELKAEIPQLDGKYPSEIAWPKGLISTVKERSLQQQLQEEPGIVDLEEVTVGAKTLQEEQTSVRKLYGVGDATLNPENILGASGFVNIFQLIQGRVSGVRVSINGFSSSVQIRGVGSVQSGTEPLYLLDNIPVDAATLGQISPRDVESIEIFKDPAKAAIFGAQGANGAIAVYTKTGAENSFQSIGGTLVTKFRGYSIPKQFYSPKYDEKSPATAVTDKRATLFWNPLVITDEFGNQQISFYNSDSAKKLLIVVEGIDPLGRLGRLVKVLE